MRTIISSALLLLAFSACSGGKQLQTSNSLSSSGGNTRTKEVEFLNDNAYRLTDFALDSTYGRKESDPVKVGGASESSGPSNERRFLNGLAGPNGETVVYYRIGSCCPFKTPNGFNNLGLLDTYKVYWEGCTDTAVLFMNMYDQGDLKIPIGFDARR
jgi:hypothetical protein